MKKAQAVFAIAVPINYNPGQESRNLGKTTTGIFRGHCTTTSGETRMHGPHLILCN
jgi:hypothetical protein